MSIYEDYVDFYEDLRNHFDNNEGSYIRAIFVLNVDD